ncbi:methylase, partial [Mycolicibacterium fortuitum]
ARPPRLSRACVHVAALVAPLRASAGRRVPVGSRVRWVQPASPNPRKTLADLSAAGLDADIVAWQWIPFGPVLTSRAEWLEETGRLEPGRREEELLVIRADKP